jgi:hypothetical protein
MLRHCTITRMSERRVREIVCRCWPELHAGRFVTAGSLAQLDRGVAVEVLWPAAVSPEFEGQDRDGARVQAGDRLVPFADRRARRPPLEPGLCADDEGPFDDAV